MTSTLLDRDRAARLLHEIDRTCGNDKNRRRQELENLRSEYIIASVARRVAALPEHGNASQDKLRTLAQQILAKAGASTSAPQHAKRTREEQRMVGSARVSWHKFLRAEGVRGPRPWSRQTPNVAVHSSSNLLLRLTDDDLQADQGRALLRDYVANQALHLLNVVERAKSINPNYLAPEVHNRIVELYSASVKA